MIIIPELKMVVICTPKTGTTSLISAVKKRYPKSSFPYRHMEASSIPKEYKNWRKVGVFRDPVERLWSLYKYAAKYQSDSPKVCKHYISGLNESVKDISFEDWLLNNDFCFTQPYNKNGEISEKYLVENIIPENRKSQFLYLRPDLGTEIINYEELYKLENLLDLKLPKLNTTIKSSAPKLRKEVMKKLLQDLEWDFSYQKNKKS